MKETKDDQPPLVRSVVSPRADRPNGLIVLVYLGGLSLAIGAVTLGIGMLRA